MTSINKNIDSEIHALLNFLCSSGELQIKCGTLFNLITNNRAKYYFQYGLCRRLSIITKNLYFFYSTTPPARHMPLDNNEAGVATMHINSLYVNLAGAINNMAWTLTHEFNLYPDISDIETSSKRNEINLFYKEFSAKIKMINDIFYGLKEYLDTKKNWHNELLKFRHPSTHRIPLYVIPSILDKLEAEKYSYHQTQHLEEAIKHNFENADEHFNQLNSLGNFIPLFSHDPDIKPAPIYPTIITDCENLIEITNKFLTCMRETKN